MKSIGTTFVTLSAVALVLALIVPAQASFFDMESWSSPPSVEGWTGGSSHPLYNGGPIPNYLNDGGFLGVRSDDYSGGSYVGADLPASYAGDWGAMFGTSGNIEFDIKVWSGASGMGAAYEVAADGIKYGYDPNNVMYGSMGAGSYFNLYNGYIGWRYSLGTQGPASGVVHRIIPFDATWSDAQALAAGWVAGEYGAGTWAGTVANVGVGVGGSGFKFASTAYSISLGIDHFVPGPEIIPEPSAMILMGLGGVLLCGRSRRRSQEKRSV